MLRLVGNGWDLLVFEAVDGRHASYTPGSHDLPLLIETMKKLGSIPAPDIPIKLAEQRWKPYFTEPQHAHLLAGDALLHTDYAPDNVIIIDGRAVLIDWAWPTRDAGWVDPACLILRLMAAGHSAAQAEEVVSPLPAWSVAPPDVLAAFAAASANLWTEIAGHDQSSWTKAMELAALEWAAYRAAR
ncbi:aminoglycoside phosphotransferase [Actinomadura sp. KC06]|uniref:aminoglycoside phosphotransferase n=1 Tax=Actinomadura sp. KC06 TaxID=2530369 RepID=UPI0010459AAC|nr:aminoglycoside phosphotransferase [Actinomadura sp. KC06]TDD32107.1 aminoglycoside phosphotransferase [Actinomadura sp. KC06]